MGRILAMEFVTLDGVMQAPGRPDEDTRGGFPYGGWAAPYDSPEQFRMASEGIGQPSGAMLLGRRTYLDFYHVWHGRTDNPFSEWMDRVPKYVASTTLEEPLPWQHSTLLRGDVAGTLKRIKAEEPAGMLMMGSGVLFRTLLEHDLLDRLVLLTYPLVLGTGRRLFAEGGPPATFRLLDARQTSTGVVIATYERGTATGGDR